MSDKLAYGQEWVLIIGFIVWLTFTLFQLRFGFNKKTIRRSFFLLVGMTGLILLILRPKMTMTSELIHVDILTSGDNLPPLSKTSFSNINKFLNSEVSHRTDTVHIKGDGLPLEELDLISDYNIKYHMGKLTPGITSFDYHEITEYSSWTMTGSYRGDVKSIVVNDPKGEVIKCSLKDSAFSAKLVGPPAGEYLLPIKVFFQNGDSTTEYMPIKSNKSARYNLLSLSSHPSFEINFLKNYWASQGHGFVQRQKVSQEKYISSFVNAIEVNLEKLSPNLVNKFDILLFDLDTWNQLSNAERNAVLEQVKNNGKGLIFRPSEKVMTDQSLQLPKLNSSKEITWKAKYSNPSILVFPILSSPNGWSSLSHKKEKIGTYRSLGLGHILLLTVEDTYQLLLADENDEYQELWAKVFSLLYKDYTPASTLITSKWIWENEKTHLQLITDKPLENLPILDDSIPLPYIESPFIANSYELDLWAEKGSHIITIPNSDDKLSFYVHGQSDWKAVRQDYLSSLNSKVSQKSHEENKPKMATRRVEIPYVYWYLLTLLGFGALWLDEKLY